MSARQQVLRDVLKVILKQGARGGVEIGREGRKQMALRALKQKQTRIYRKLGKEVEQLIQQGELQHPGLERALKHLAQVEAEIAELQRSTAIEPSSGDSEN
jgi:hypothetical protein